MGWRARSQGPSAPLLRWNKTRERERERMSYPARGAPGPPQRQPIVPSNPQPNPQPSWSQSRSCMGERLPVWPASQSPSRYVASIYGPSDVMSLSEILNICYFRTARTSRRAVVRTYHAPWAKNLIPRGRRDPALPPTLTPPLIPCQIPYPRRMGIFWPAHGQTQPASSHSGSQSRQPQPLSSRAI